MNNFLSVSSACKINVENINSIIAIDETGVDEIRKNKKITCIDMSADNTIRSAIVTNDNFIFLFSLKVDTIFNKLDKLITPTK